MRNRAHRLSASRRKVVFVRFGLFSFLFLLGGFLGFLGVVLWLVVAFGCFFPLIFLLQTIFYLLRDPPSLLKAFYICLIKLSEA